MCFHHRSIKTQQRRPAISFGIHSLFDRAESVLGQQCAQLAAQVGFQLPFEHRKNADRQAFARLEHDIADEPVAHYHLDAAFEEVVSFNVSDKVKVKLLAEFEGLE